MWREIFLNLPHNNVTETKPYLSSVIFCLLRLFNPLVLDSAMSPSNPHISSQLKQLIFYHLDNNLVRNALFLAGRLHAYEPRSSEASYLLALCHLQSGQVKAAWNYSRNSGSRGTHIGCSYVYAQACLDLGTYVDGVTALERSKGLWVTKNNWSKRSQRVLQSKIPSSWSGSNFHSCAIYRQA